MLFPELLYKIGIFFSFGYLLRKSTCLSLCPRISETENRMAAQSLRLSGCVQKDSSVKRDFNSKHLKKMSLQFHWRYSSKNSYVKNLLPSIDWQRKSLDCAPGHVSSRCYCTVTYTGLTSPHVISPVRLISPVLGTQFVPNSMFRFLRWTNYKQKQNKENTKTKQKQNKTKSKTQKQNKSNQTKPTKQTKNPKT